MFASLDSQTVFSISGFLGLNCVIISTTEAKTEMLREQRVRRCQGTKNVQNSSVMQHLTNITENCSLFKLKLPMKLFVLMLALTHYFILEPVVLLLCSGCTSAMSQPSPNSLFTLSIYASHCLTLTDCKEKSSQNTQILQFNYIGFIDWCVVSSASSPLPG